MQAPRHHGYSGIFDYVIKHLIFIVMSQGNCEANIAGEHGYTSSSGATGDPQGVSASAPRGEHINDFNDSTSSIESTLSKAIALQSLLAQFSHPMVRADFVNGRFGWNINPTLLPQLDELRWSLVPRWQSGDLTCSIRDCGPAARILQQLLGESDEVILSDDTRQYTCKQWMQILDAIASDPYWTNVSPEERCVHIVKREARTFSEIKQNTQVPSVAKSRRSQKAKKLSYTLDSSLSSMGSSVSGGSDSGSEVKSYSVSSRKGSRRRKSHREIVTPPVFEMDGKTGLQDYLISFEKYFEKKFDGDEYDQTQELGKFLKGELLQVYSVQGGRKL